MPRPKPQHNHPEDVMRLALQRVQPLATLRDDDDDPMQVLSDAIDEVLALRQAYQDTSSFYQQWLAKFARR